MDFRRWALTKYKGNTGSRTFLFLDKGKFSLNDDDVTDMYLRYVSAVHSGQTVRLVEVKTQPCFVFFCDLDFSGVDETFVRSATLDIATAFLRYTSAASALVARCFRQSKFGVHLVIPTYMVTCDQATALCANVVSEIGSAQAVLDTTVYRKATGLRMVYSAKKGETCVYEPWFRVGGETGCELEAATDARGMFSYVQQFTIQCSNQGMPVRKVNLTESESKSSAFTTVPNSNDDVSEMIRKLRVFKIQDRITKVNVLVPGRRVALHTDSRVCRNMRRPHTSATIWYEATIVQDTLSLYQRCRCTCLSTDRVHNKRCKDFRFRVCYFHRTPQNHTLFQVFEKAVHWTA
jgi:hypothetical protein